MAVEEKDILEIPTNVVSLTSLDTPSKATTILIVPGSPGACHFYIPFMLKLYQLFQQKINISAISHAGHAPGAYRNSSQRRWFNLKEQVNHKIAFLESQVPNDSDLILIGHSIGCYMIMQMMKTLPKQKVKKCIFLCPTIERMNETSSGKKLRPFFTWLKPFVLFFIWLASIFPSSIKRCVFNQRFKLGLTPRSHVSHMTEACLSFSSLPSLYNILSMAEEEMNTVITLDQQVLRDNEDIITMYYTDKDHWVPDDACELMKRNFPNIDVISCNQGIKHAFVLKDSEAIAEFVFSNLQNF